MAFSGVSLNAATSTGAGSAIIFETPRSTHGVYYNFTGGTSYGGTLELTFDGSTWVSSGITIGADPEGWQFQSATNHPAIGARVNLTSISGGSITAWIVSY